jgi:DNA-binding XRE family transcriptional regulator
MPTTKRGKLITPTAGRVLFAREMAGLTQAEAAEIIHLSHPVRWSEYERGRHTMPMASWELFLFKTGLRDLPELVETTE